MPEKTCRKCGALRSLDEFYRHKMMADGHLNICKPCKISYQRRYSKTDAGKATERKRNQKPARKKALARQVRKWRNENPEKNSAHSKLSRAVATGKISKPENCESCGKSGVIHGHHEDYSKPLDVEWLCVHCHGGRHPDTEHQFSIFSL